MSQTVLLIAPQPAGNAVAQKLHERLCLEVFRCTASHEGRGFLRREDVSLILLDENVAAADTLATDALYAAAVSTPVLEISFALWAADRVVRQVHGALLRRTRDEAKARTAAATALRHELNASITGLLLASQLALPGADSDLARALHQVIQLADEVRGHMIP